MRNSNWRTHAACRDEDPELFFPVGNSQVTRRKEAQAAAVCARCPVRDACQDAGATQSHGIWNGRNREFVNQR